jgi:alpha-galactosidase
MAKTNNLKIVMVGGGSYNWCPRLLSDIMQAPEINGSEVVLLDPNLKAAEEVKAAAETMAKTLKVKFSFRATSNEASAFKDCDFVIITISTGDLEMMAHDLAIPEKYGIFQTVGDTAGPGGWCRALRNVPVFEKMARKIEKYSPKAVVLNYTNPMAVLTAVINEVSSLRNVGLCHGLFGNYRVLKKIFNCEEKDISVNFAGVNHFFWIKDFTIKGKSGYPLLSEKLQNKSIDQLLKEGETDEAGFHSNHALCDNLLKEFGYLPFVADRHICEFIPGLLSPKASSLKAFKLLRTSIKERKENRSKARKRAMKLATGKLQPMERTRETAVDIIKAVAFDKPFIDVVNLPNLGQVENLPIGAIVETLGVVDPLGFRGVSAGKLPAPIQALVEPHCRVQMMTAKAALEGNKELALQSLMLDPMCSHLAPYEIREMGFDLMSATKDWLPQFK